MKLTEKIGTAIDIARVMNHAANVPDALKKQRAGHDRVAEKLSRQVLAGTLDPQAAEYALNTRG